MGRVSRLLSAVGSSSTGADLLVVKNRASFAAAYPQVDPTWIAGRLPGSLNNVG